MRFFLPHTKTGAEAESVFQSIKSFLSSEGYESNERRVRRIAFTHNGIHQVAEVGQIFGPIAEPVIAILKGRTYFVCTPSRGVVGGMPISVGENEIVTVEHFELEKSVPQPV